jgi:hypothetical protein
MKESYGEGRAIRTSSPMKFPTRIDTISSRDAASATTVEPPERGHAYPSEPSAAHAGRGCPLVSGAAKGVTMRPKM